ncbi:hypothetical protein C0J52_06463 [Blattella germanica]|nr:hypothetical protein C0J52_06463 [Blattella germanica]
MSNISGYCKKNKSKIVYPNCQSALKPVLHGTDYPVPIPPSSDAMNNEESDTEDNDSDSGAMEYTNDTDSGIKKATLNLISQVDLITWNHLLNSFRLNYRHSPPIILAASVFA